jgi:hypothetical protein
MTNRNGIHHIVSDTHVNGDKSFCGRAMYSYDMPIKLSHAKLCVEQGTYLQPCKRCLKKALAISLTIL